MEEEEKEEKQCARLEKIYSEGRFKVLYVSENEILKSLVYPKKMSALRVIDLPDGCMIKTVQYDYMKGVFAFNTAKWDNHAIQKPAFSQEEI